MDEVLLHSSRFLGPGLKDSQWVRTNLTRPDLDFCVSDWHYELNPWRIYKGLKVTRYLLTSLFISESGSGGGSGKLFLCDSQDNKSCSRHTKSSSVIIILELGFTCHLAMTLAQTERLQETKSDFKTTWHAGRNWTEPGLGCSVRVLLNCSPESSGDISETTVLP